MMADDEVVKHLIFLYERQTDDELQNDSTRHANGKGFNGADAKILTSCAKFFLLRGFLTQKQRDTVAKRLKKYHKQLPPVDYKIEQKCLIF